MKLAPVVFAALLLASALSAEARVAVPGKAQPIRDDSPGYGGGPVRGQWAHVPGDFEPFSNIIVLAGTTTNLWLRLAASQAIDDVITFHATAGTVNRTEVRVVLAAGQTTAIPVAVTLPANSTGHVVQLRAVFNATRYGDAGPLLAFDQGASLMAPVSVSFVAPKASYDLTRGYPAPVPHHLGFQTPVDFRVKITNHGTSSYPSRLIGLHAFGNAVRTTQVPTLAPGESREVSLGTFRFVEDLPQYAPMASYGGSIQVEFGTSLDFAGERGYTPNWAFSFANGTLTDARTEIVMLNFYSGVIAQAESVNLTLGKPSWVDVSVTNYGEERATNIRLDIVVSPQPAAYYGPGTYVKETRWVSLDPLEEKRLNISFTARVAGTVQVTVTPHIPGYYAAIQKTFALHTPVTFAPVESPAVLLGQLGASKPFSFRVNSSQDLRGAEVGFAIASANQWRSDIPYVRFITGDDILVVKDAPRTIDLVGNKTVFLNGTVEFHAAGSYFLVPYVRVGDIVYVSRPAVLSGESPSGLPPMPGSYEVRVRTADLVVATIWLPLASVIVGFAGYWVWRRRYVL